MGRWTVDADLLDRMAEWLRRHSWLKRHHAAHRTFNGKGCWRCEAAKLVREYDARKRIDPMEYVYLSKGEPHDR